MLHLAHSAASDVKVGFVHRTTGRLFSKSMQYLHAIVVRRVV